MKILLTIALIFLLAFSFGQSPTKISGRIVDENGKPVGKAMLFYGNIPNDTAYTDELGRFSVAYPNPQRYSYHFYVERKDFFPKSFFVDLSENDIILKKPILLRSRQGFWYDPKQIDSTHLGITVREALKRYKLDIDACLLWDEPPGRYHHFSTELCDSSYIYITFQGIFTTEKRLKMIDILDRKVTAIAISFTNGERRIFGNGFIRENPYLVEQKMTATQN